MNVSVFIWCQPKAPKSKKIEYRYVIVGTGNTSRTVSDKGILSNTTKNRALLKACIEAMKRFTAPATITIHTDSPYIDQGHKSLPDWIKNGWSRNNGLDLKNVDLWQELHGLESRHGIRCQVQELDSMFKDVVI